MFSFFSKKTQVDDLAWLGVDIHSHLLPGIDDGSPDVATSVHLIKELNELGYTKFFCTPHVFTELYPNTPETIYPALDSIRIALKKASIDIQIDTAAEYMVDETFKISDNLLSLPGKYILIEMSFLSEVPNIEKVIFDLQISGFQVVLAHPERYNYYHKDTLRFNRFKEMGVLFQLNLLAVTGYYGKEVKVTSEYLLDNRFYDLAGTDLHHIKHLKALTATVRNGSLYKKIGEYPFRNKELFF
jgi:protein-tyrosine phosphatase